MRKCKGYKCRIKNLCERFTNELSNELFNLDMRHCTNFKKFIRKGEKEN